MVTENHLKANLIPGSRDIDQLQFGGGEIVLQHSVFFFQQEFLKKMKKKNGAFFLGPAHVLRLNLFVVLTFAADVHVCRLPEPTSIFLTSASVSYHIWTDPGSCLVSVIRRTMQ